jgi:hypothetical protein
MATAPPIQYKWWKSHAENQATNPLIESITTKQTSYDMQPCDDGVGRM